MQPRTVCVVLEPLPVPCPHCAVGWAWLAARLAAARTAERFARWRLERSSAAA
ncbi:hypothetical protein [Myxococcus sp. RHSTA-1-4]|uniref:hypothetical protein n=1 Tax=Myxococcus sp. RHSTA-1-4 TaxID=2874601 RepID=UPI001CBB3FDF|nr:hypothetical protein [Myxococcus sp. RHSTA-1-4]MBZ4422030.1 hypothetical protein [Myxococcus sp. RHSTA-1-4]